MAVFSKINRPAENEAEKITSTLIKEIIDSNNLKQIQNMGYGDFKSSINAKNDFCIYIEDGNGNVILSKGSSKLNDGVINCKE